MALKDFLKHFKDYDDYRGSLTKADYDDNIDLLADNIDKKAFEISEDGSVVLSLYPGKSFSTLDGITTGNGFWFNASSRSFKGGIITGTDAGELSFCYGANNTVSGISSFAIGVNITSSGYFAQSFGADFENKQNQSLALGFGSGIFNRYTDNIQTSDDTQTGMNTPILLKPKSAYLIKNKLIALKDDYSTKWIAEFEHIVTIDDAGTITINTTQNDLVKDDTSWSIEFEAVNDSSNPNVVIKVTGAASTNISWGIFGDICELNL
jgi:hypothetical protein